MAKHAIVHIEIPADDRKAAGQFYGGLFGWDIQADEAMDYVMYVPEDGPGGGFSPVGDQVKPGEVLLYVDTDDIDAMLAKVTSLGGEVIRPKTEIPTIGWFGLFRDPTGNVMALWTGMGASE